MQVQNTGLGVTIRGWYLKLCRRRKPLTRRELIEERGGPRMQPWGSQHQGSAVSRVREHTLRREEGVVRGLCCELVRRPFRQSSHPTLNDTN